jgi:anti-anti-sigma factor
MSGHPPQQADLTLRTSCRDDTVTIQTHGDLRAPATQQFRIRILEALQTRPKRLLLDLGAVRGLDDTGLGVLLIARLWAQKQDARLDLIPSPAIHDRLTEARLDRYFTFIGPDSA